MRRPWRYLDALSLPLLLGALIAPAVLAQNCCTHEGGSVACPSGLPAGSHSVQFVPGGTIWQTPSGTSVSVPSTSFAPCSQAPTTTQPAAPTKPPTVTAPTQTPPQPPAKTPSSPGASGKSSTPPPRPKLDLNAPEPTDQSPQFPQPSPGNATQGDQAMPPVILGPGTTAADDKNTTEMIHRLAAARKRECPCDCYDMVDKLPAGYRIVRGADVNAPGQAGKVLDEGGIRFVAEMNSSRPSRWLTWDSSHCVWRPPGFVPDPGDSSHLFDRATGQNAAWDNDNKQWIDTRTGKPLGYEQ